MTPLVIDNFAGGGGASTGIERALGRPVDVAINHDPEAVAMHVANHPTTRHFCQSIMAVDPLVATGGQPVALAWFSPDCKHHSKAKGGKPREKNIRDLAWIVVHWAERLRKATPDGRGAPAIIMLENVEEFRQWGPLDAEGKPIAERKGEEFDLWVRGLKRQGYKVQYRELRACDYGAPTSRKRLFLIARRDGLPIVWPKPTHGKPDSAEVEAGKLLPYRTAAECIDWSIPCPSIFARKRPLKDATHRRIAHGVMRYVVNAASPFIVGTAFTSTRAARIFDPLDPLRTATAQPEYAVVDAAIIPITHTGDPARVHDRAEPLRTVTTANGGELARATVTLAPHVTKFRTGSVGSDAGRPMPTVTANGGSARPAAATPLGIAAATMVQMGYGEREGQAPRALDVEAPLGTVVAGGGKHGVVVGMLGRAADQPMTTITATGSQQRIVRTTMIEAGDLPPDQLARAVQVAAFLVKYYGSGDTQAQAADRPLDTVTTLARFAVVTVTIDTVTYVIVDIGMRMLTRRELANAQGFPADYILDPVGPNGKPLTISSSIRMIGNSVCPDMAEALVRANVPAEMIAQVAA